MFPKFISDKSAKKIKFGIFYVYLKICFKNNVFSAKFQITVSQKKEHFVYDLLILSKVKTQVIESQKQWQKLVVEMSGKIRKLKDMSNNKNQIIHQVVVVPEVSA